MKQLVSVGPCSSKLIETEMPQLSTEYDVIVKLKYCGVCMSEHYDWAHAGPGQSFGHEPVGVVFKVGPKVTRVKVGSRVSGPFGGYSEYSCTHENNLILIPNTVKDEEAVIEPLGCLYSAVSKVRIPVVGDRVAVVGCGYMGCGAISLLKKRGAYVVGFDIRPECLNDAKKYGADEVYTPEQWLSQNSSDFKSTGVGTWNGSGGFALVMEWGETNESLDFAIQITAMCGLLAIGAYHTGEKRLVDVRLLNVKAIDCLSTHPREWDLLLRSCQNAMDALAADCWSFKKVPTKIYPITQFDAAQAELTQKYGRFMKAIVDWTRFDGEPYLLNE